MNDLIIKASIKAFNEITLYKSHYKTEPQCLENIIPCDIDIYSHQNSFVDCISSLKLIQGTIPPYLLTKSYHPFTVVESQLEMELRHKRTMECINSLTYTKQTKSKKFLLLTDEITGPFCSHLISSLAWERHSACAIYWTNLDQTISDINNLNPDFLIISSVNIPIDSTKKLFNQFPNSIQLYHIPFQFKPDNELFPALLASDQFYIFAYRRKNESQFVIPTNDIVAEHDSNHNINLFTTILNDLNPFIRFNLPISNIFLNAES